MTDEVRDFQQVVEIGFPGKGEWAMAALVNEDGVEHLFWLPSSIRDIEIGQYIELHGEYEGTWALAYLSKETLLLGGHASNAIT